MEDIPSAPEKTGNVSNSDSALIAASGKISEGEELKNVVADIEGITEAVKQVILADPPRRPRQTDLDPLKECGSNSPSKVENEEVNKILEVISKYLSLAVHEKDSRKHSLLLKDEGIAQFLVLALMNDSMDVVSAAMEVFEILLSGRRNHPALQKLPYFLPTLEKIARNKKKYPMNIRCDALNMLRAINETKQPLGESSMQNVANVTKGPGPSKTSTLAKAKQRGRETILKVGSGVLQHDQNRVRIQRTLIKVNGIISLTFNLQKNYCIIRGKHNVWSDVFGTAVANLGFDVSLVCKNELNEEVLIPISQEKNNELSQENLPDYLPEDDDETSSVADNAVCKKKSQENTKDSSIFNSALSFVRSSFYW